MLTVRSNDAKTWLKEGQTELKRMSNRATTNINWSYNDAPTTLSQTYNDPIGIARKEYTK